VRRIATIVVLSVLASGSFAIPPASASAPSWPATFRGLTDPQLLPIQLDVIQRRDGTLGLSDLFVDIELTCPSGERIGFGTGVGYFPALPLDGNRVSIDEIFGNQAFHVHARVSSNRIRGTVSMALAAFTPDEQLQRCDSPIERFTAERVPETTTAAATHSPLTRTTFTVRKDGTSTRSRVVLTSRSIAAADQATSYRGKTDQHLPIRFDLRGTGDRGSIDRAEFATRLRCDDGTSAGTWSLGIIWIGGGLPVLKRAFVLDDVEFDSALHWSGHVGDVRARGRLRFAVPAFTHDERLQVCGSGGVHWRAHAG
jgi:hypothetical protein